MYIIRKENQDIIRTEDYLSAHRLYKDMALFYPDVKLELLMDSKVDVELKVLACHS